MNCQQCGIELESKRKDTKYCSAKCRKDASREKSIVTDNVTLNEPDVTDNFQFTIISSKDDPSDVKKEKAKVREAIYWYDIPLGALPIIQKGWPEMPEYMNGRQYFLWWKNEFKLTEEGTPILHNPFPIRENLTYVRASGESRRWGA